MQLLDARERRLDVEMCLRDREVRYRDYEGDWDGI